LKGRPWTARRKKLFARHKDQEIINNCDSLARQVIFHYTRLVCIDQMTCPHVDQVIFHYAPDSEDKFYFLAAKVFDLKIECQIFKCRDFERPRFQMSKFRKIKISNDQDLDFLKF
jgi:hypothetical protein